MEEYYIGYINQGNPVDKIRELRNIKTEQLAKNEAIYKATYTRKGCLQKIEVIKKGSNNND